MNREPYNLIQVSFQDSSREDIFCYVFGKLSVKNFVTIDDEDVWYKVVKVGTIKYRNDTIQRVICKK